MHHNREIGIVGLGRMGGSVGENLRDKDYKVLGFDISEQIRERFNNVSIDHEVNSINELRACLKSPCVIMIFLPAGQAVDDTITSLLPSMQKGDILIDCGNSYYKDAERRAAFLEPHGIDFMDIGVSGGLSGARNGACLTVGGKRELFYEHEHLFKAMSAENGYLYAGETGCGHLVKTVHNGIEYGFLQAIGEGLNVIKTMSDKKRLSIDIAKLCEVWCNGSIIESRLMDDAAKAIKMLNDDPSIVGKIGGGETGKWAKQMADESGVDVPVLDAALKSRKESRNRQSFTGKIIAAIRNVFGGHELFTSIK